MYNLIKRLFDIIISGVLIIVLFPLMLPIIILLKVTGEGHVFYHQKRIGYKKKYFNMIKFATMLKNSPNIGTGSITLRNDPRLLPLGKFLRMTKINELPQLLNVLKGDMSFVGPRPLVDRTFNCYSVDVQSKIYDVKPGITGIGSILFRDEEAMISSASMPPHQYYQVYVAPYKGMLEMWYLENRSFFVDLKILFMTLWVVIFPTTKLIHKAFNNLPERQISLAEA
jgi:lipopolysaccharide/colanic/teichoic acid biosynthesis glycosyltransferase